MGSSEPERAASHFNPQGSILPLIHVDTSFLIRALVPGTAEDRTLRSWIKDGLAALFFNRSGRRRGTLADCMIAVTAMNAGAILASSNPDDFKRLVVEGLQLANTLG